MKKIKKALYFLIFLSIILGISYYFILYKEKTIECGIVTDYKEEKKNYIVTLYFDNKTEKVKIPKNKFDVSKIAYNIKMKGIFISYISPAQQLEGTFNSRDKNSIQIEEKPYILEDKIEYIMFQESKPKTVSKKYFVVGNSGYSYLLNQDGKIKRIIINSPPKLDTIRVGISLFNNNKYIHKSLLLYSKRTLEISNGTQTYKIPSTDKILVKFENNKISLYQKTKENESKILETSNKVKITPYKNSLVVVETEDKIQTEALKQSNQTGTNSSFKPSYPGIIEITPNKDGFFVVNEVNIDDYLLYVVPSEVPYSAGYEGYKAQTIAARTYAVSDMLIGRFEKYGFHVDDSTFSQVYNSQPTNDLVKKAVAETAGLVMTYEDKIIDAKYYSTSCGFGASYDEVWPETEKNTKPYLSFANYSSVNIDNLKNDSDALTFFKDWTITAIDSASPYFRWKYALTAKQLNSIINDKIYDIYKNNKNNFKQKWILDFYKAASISEEGIGTIKDIYINDHSKSGLVNEMVIISEKGTFKITGSNIIKRLLTPTLKDQKIEITRLRGNPLENVDSLPSPFFSIDRDFKQTTLTGITVYGGGYGHGVGMSQYGLIESSRIGKSYDTILKTFYKNIEFTNINDIKID